MANKLFSEFPPVPTEKWEEVIIKDLKGADYDKRLVWRTHEGFNVRPYYRAEDLKNLRYMGSRPGCFPFVRGTKKDNEWYIHQGISAFDGDFAKANTEAKVLLTKGLESIGFYLDTTKIHTKEDYALLLKGIDLTVVPVSFCGCSIQNIESLAGFLAYVDSLGVDKEAVNAIFDFNPLMTLTTKGYFCEETSFEKLAECVKATQEYKNIRVITVDATTFNGAGASSTQELAFALAEGSEYISRLTDLGLSTKDVAKKMVFVFSVGSSYFMEIAKFRAARMLWANVVEAYGADSNCAKKMKIFAYTSEWNQTVYDSYVNMLRATTEAMSAALAGVDYLEVVPFDFAYQVPGEFSSRIARNIQSILKEESNFNRVVDPAAGSYYVENLTNSLAEAAWKLFTDVESAGG
ncbi:MAG: methylmalonyl-CoA mutase small subunit, partial [Bacteroidales bacterium]|nr:methylmalonyl-CoA mutase small subunit [Bacteroidales bacterium]